ncbi:MAG: type II toxin-antitoxin system Phd/YefM family antitoxin [Phycisphaeraceae bacterium]
MIAIDDIDSLSSFQRNAKAHMRKLKKSGRPSVLTVNGKPALIVQDAEAYQRMLDAIERADTIAAIQQAMERSRHVKGKPLAQAFKSIRRKIAARARGSKP